MYQDYERKNVDNSVLFKTIQQKDKVFEFLKGLNQKLDQARSQVLGKEPILSIREIFVSIKKAKSRLQLMMKKTNPQPTTRNTILENSTLAFSKPEPMVLEDHGVEIMKKINCGVIIVTNHIIIMICVRSFMRGLIIGTKMIKLKVVMVMDTK